MIVALVAVLLVILILGVLDAGRRIVDLDGLRDQALESESDAADVAGASAAAFRRLRGSLDGGDRFALVFSPDVGRDQRGFYRLVSLSYLYPALATSDPVHADAVMVFGEPSPSIREDFEELGVVDGVWLGHRPS